MTDNRSARCCISHPCRWLQNGSGDLPAAQGQQDLAVLERRVTDEGMMEGYLVMVEVRVSVTVAVWVSREVLRAGAAVWRIGSRLAGGGETGTTRAARWRVGARGRKGAGDWA